MGGGFTNGDGFRRLHNAHHKAVAIGFHTCSFDSVGFDSPVNLNRAVGRIDLMKRKVVVQNNVSVQAGQAVNSAFNLAVEDDVSLVLNDQALVGH